MEPTEAIIGHHVNLGLGRSPHGDIGTCLLEEATVTLFWAADQRRDAEVGGDSDRTRASMLGAEVGTPVPFHIDDEVNRFIACGTSRSEEVKTTKGFYTSNSNSQPNVIEPNATTRPPLPTTGASPPKIDWQSTGSWPPWCASPSKDSSFPTEGRDLESICQAAVRRIDECLEVVA